MADKSYTNQEALMRCDLLLQMPVRGVTLAWPAARVPALRDSLQGEESLGKNLLCRALGRWSIQDRCILVNDPRDDFWQCRHWHIRRNIQIPIWRMCKCPFRTHCECGCTIQTQVQSGLVGLLAQSWFVFFSIDFSCHLCSFFRTAAKWA